MLNIETLDELRGNNVIIYSIKSLLSKKTYPHFSIMAGHMGVGKSTVARLVAKELNKAETSVHVFNLGSNVNMKEIEETVFRMNPMEPRAFIFEEMHGLDKGQQTALLTMLDSQPANVYVIGTTTELSKILNTIQSRAQVWNFKLLGQKQLSQLLEDYLTSQNVLTVTKAAKNALLQSAMGVPRDLLKNADLAISGEFTSEQLNSLLGRVSEDLMFSLFCSLKSQSIDFASVVEEFIEQSSETKLYQLRDFWTRYLLESKGIDNPTLSKDKIKQLQELYSSADAMRVGNVLVKATPATLILELVLLNMELTRTAASHQLGQQRDKKAMNTVQGAVSASATDVNSRVQAARLTSTSLQNLRLDSL